MRTSKPTATRLRPDPPPPLIHAGSGMEVREFHAALAELAQIDKSDLDVALERIVAVAAATLDVARVSYWELASDHSSIACRVLYMQADRSYRRGDRLLASQFPTYFEALITNPEIVAEDAWIDPRTSEFVESYFMVHGIRAMLDIPVWRRGKLAGVLCHEHVARRPWLPEEQAFAVGVANIITAALETRDRHRAEEGYALIARATNDVLWDWDPRTGEIQWNDTATAVFRLQPAQIGHRLDWWLGCIHADDRARVQGKVASLLRSEENSYTDQYRFVRGDGSIATIIDGGIVVRDREGLPVRMVGSMLDITDRVEMQNRLALSDRMASLGTLAAGVAHEINNPLTYVMTNLALAIEDTRVDTCHIPAVNELLREAQEGAERIRQIVRNLQALSRSNDEEAQVLELAPVIESSINVAHNEIRHRAQLVREFRDVPTVRMNRGRLAQVVLNLLINAVHAIEEGRANDNEIRVGTFAREKEVVIEVRDTGCGIPVQHQARIFDPFFTTKPIGKGTGLGLSICHSIVVAAGGRIEVESSPRGTTMRVVLPAATAEVVAPGPAAAPVAPKRRILLVDDEPLIRRSMTRLLGSKHSVVAVEDGNAALAELERDAGYDLILCDLMMPAMSGMELYRRLVEMGSPFAQRMVLMTGGAFSAESEAFLNSCERPHIAKPVDRGVLERILIEIPITSAP